MSGRHKAPKIASVKACNATSPTHTNYQIACDADLNLLLITGMGVKANGMQLCCASDLLSCAVLCCAVPCCAVLCCAVLCCVALCCAPSWKHCTRSSFWFACAKASSDAKCMPILQNASGLQLQAQAQQRCSQQLVCWAFCLHTNLHNKTITIVSSPPKLRACHTV